MSFDQNIVCKMKIELCRPKYNFSEVLLVVFSTVVVFDEAGFELAFVVAVVLGEVGSDTVKFVLKRISKCFEKRFKTCFEFQNKF